MPVPAPPLLSHRTVSLLITDDQVLLGFKKTGFGQGKYLGIGGKIESGETPAQAATREITEEIAVTDAQLQPVGVLTFTFPHQPSWSQVVHVFVCRQWQGQPTESSEIKPEWFDQAQLPLSQMWDDAQFWLPAVLNGHSLVGEFIFDPDLKVVNVSLEEMKGEK